MKKEILHPLHVLVALVLLLCMKTSSLGPKSLSEQGNLIRCNERERRALLGFKPSHANKDNLLDSWKQEEEEDCCKWIGVGCDNLTGHVTHLHLSSLVSPSSDSCSFPIDSTSVNIDHSLLDLQYLKYLDLSRNSILGFPENIGSLTNLVHLDFSETCIGGLIPYQIGKLSKLQYLNLSFSGFDGPVPKFMGSLKNLRYLDLSCNSFSGVIPHELGNLSKLEYLDLGFGLRSNSQPTGGNFEWLFNLSSLTHLDLGFLNISPPGIWESFIERIPSLSVLRLYSCELSAPISTSSNFSSSISTLHLGGNHINSSIFNWISHLRGSLVELDLEGNEMDGMIPDFTRFTSLEFLYLSNNEISGSIPDFTGCSSLKELSLDNNEFSGSIPDFTGCSSLEFLDLSNNEFSGSIPDFTGCSSLKELFLSHNQLTQWETQSIGLLYSLERLDLSMNSIRSTISEAQLSNISSLRFMRTSFNPLTFEFNSQWLPPFQLSELYMASCKLGPKFPHWIRTQGELSDLDISNNQISDTIPLWFWNLSIFTSLNLSSNQIRGSFPSKVLIPEIDLSSNFFHGPLPSIHPDCLKINLSRNKFSGTLHSLAVVEKLRLRFLDVSHNHLVGSLPDDLAHLDGLVFLNLGYNNFSGRIPLSIGHLVDLQTLILRSNKLHGEIPESLRNCSNLGFVDFGLNKLSGKIPSWIGEGLPHLYALILKSNRFYGHLPFEICQLSAIHFLDLSINRISGTIPPCFGNLTAMIQKGTEAAEHLYTSGHGLGILYSYFDNVLAGWKGQEFEYGRNFAYLKMIDLSTNELTGEIPLGITRLLELKGLNLSGNRFYGKVPPEIGELKALECLDLSANKFSGEIPQSMSGLNFLAFLNLSDNNFSGRIPSGTQLQGFSISTYEGNTGLCGKPLTNICPGDEPANHIHPSSSKYDVEGDEGEYKRWLYISAALGFSTSFWGFIGTLVLNRHWRRAYFLFLYNLKEQFYVAVAVHIGRLQRTV